MTDQMTWGLTASRNTEGADVICDWVRDLGGEARYEPAEREADGDHIGTLLPPCIVITGPDGPIYVHPGDTVHDIGGWFTLPNYPGPWCLDYTRRRLFRVSAAGTGETT